MSIIEVEVETLDGPLGADPRELLLDAAAHAAMEPGYAARFEDAYGLNWRGRVAFRAAAWGAARARRWPRWDGEAVLAEARRRCDRGSAAYDAARRALGDGEAR